MDESAKMHTKRLHFKKYLCTVHVDGAFKNNHHDKENDEGKDDNETDSERSSVCTEVNRIPRRTSDHLQFCGDGLHSPV